MISKQASILPRRLIRRYHTNDPFEIAAALDITVMERSDFQRQKGAFNARRSDPADSPPAGNTPALFS